MSQSLTASPSTMNSNTGIEKMNNEMPSNYTKYVFIVNGAKVSAIFSAEANNDVMDIVKDILVNSYCQ